MEGAVDQERGRIEREDLEYFRGVFLFRGLGDEQISKFLALARPVELKAGETLIKEGEKGASLYILRRGSVEVSKALTLPLKIMGSPSVEKALSRMTERDRAVFGELVLFDEDTRSATVRCLTDCTFYEIDKGHFLRFAEENVEIGYHLFKNIAEVISVRLRRSSEDVIKLSTALSIALSR